MTVRSMTPDERAAIGAAVTAAETGTDGEIVTIVTKRSDSYHDAALHYALAAVLLVAAIAAFRPSAIERLTAAFSGGWTDEHLLAHSYLALFVLQAAAFLIVRYALAWAPLRLALTPKSTKARRVRRRAVQFFRLGADQRTAARVGVLLYVSVEERRAEIVADAGVHRVVPAAAWGHAMAALVHDMRHDRAGAGMVAAVGHIGAILAEHFPKTADDVNELPDRLIEL